MSPVLLVPNLVLRTPAKLVAAIDKRVLDIIKDMEKTLLAAKSPAGVGLAAPQIGILLRLFLIRPLPDKTITLFINPEIIKYSQKTQSPSKNRGTYEGCLSLPGHYAPVTRSISVTVKYQTQVQDRSQSLLAKSPQAPAEDLRSQQDAGEIRLVEKTETFSGFPAHIIQHEMDHLNGILFIDRVLEQNAKLFKAEGDSWHEVTL